MNWALLKSVQVASYKSCKYCPSYDCLATSDTMVHLEVGSVAQRSGPVWCQWSKST